MAHTLIVHGVAADQRGAVEILCARIIHHRHAGGQYARPPPRHPVPLSPQPPEHLLHHRPHATPRPPAAHRSTNPSPHPPSPRPPLAPPAPPPGSAFAKSSMSDCLARLLRYACFRE